MTPRKTKFNVDGFCLKGILHLPHNNTPPLVVGSHGLEGSMASAKQQVLARILPQNGIAFFRFDHRGCGDSQGNFLVDTSLEKRTRDLIGAVLHALSLGLTSRRVGLFGSSMGGATCINAWKEVESQDLDLCGGVICSAPVQSLSIKNIPTQGNENRPTLPLSFFKENLLFDLREKTRALHHVLVFHGDADDVVPVSNAHQIVDSLSPPKHLIIHARGDHQMSSLDDQAEFERETLTWYQDIFN